jgi:hypothetical protein
MVCEQGHVRIEVHGEEGIEHDRLGIEVATTRWLEAAPASEGLTHRASSWQLRIEKWDEGI